MGNPMKMDDEQGYPHFWKPPYSTSRHQHGMEKVISSANEEKDIHLPVDGQLKLKQAISVHVFSLTARVHCSQTS